MMCEFSYMCSHIFSTLTFQMSLSSEEPLLNVDVMFH